MAGINSLGNHCLRSSLLLFLAYDITRVDCRSSILSHLFHVGCVIATTMEQQAATSCEPGSAVADQLFLGLNSNFFSADSSSTRSPATISLSTNDFDNVRLCFDLGRFLGGFSVFWHGSLVLNHQHSHASLLPPWISVGCYIFGGSISLSSTLYVFSMGRLFAVLVSGYRLLLPM